jgi:hypothetical protein
MDFIEGFPWINDKSIILLVMDRFSKASHFMALGHPYSATMVVHMFFTDIVHLYGIPTSIINNHEPMFTSNFWRELFVQLHMLTVLHPQSDSQSEVVNKIITMYLRCLTDDTSRQWLRWLPWAEFCYNSTFQSSIRSMLFCVGATLYPFVHTSMVVLTFQQWHNSWKKGTSSSLRSETGWNKISSTTRPTMTSITARWSLSSSTRCGSASSIGRSLRSTTATGAS